MLKYTRFFAEFSLVGFFQPMCMRKFKGCSLGKKTYKSCMTLTLSISYISQWLKVIWIMESIYGLDGILQ